MPAREQHPPDPSPRSLGIESLAPDPEEDQGLSLEELGQAYAAVLSRGADPYPEDDEVPPGSSVGNEASAAADDDQAQRVLPGSDDDACEITPRSIAEAILFVGHPLGDALTSKNIASLMRGVTPAEIDDLVAELNEGYLAEGRPYTIRSVGSGYQLVLRDEFDSLKGGFYGKVREARLSQSAIDVLAIVAYNQRITHEEIDRIRGRDSSAILSQLVRRDLLAIERPAEKKGKPVYRTTERFLDLYNLESLEDLPQVERNL